MTRLKLPKIAIFTFWFIIVWLLYSYSLFYEFFIFDDALHITNNAHITSRSLKDIYFFWTNSLTPMIFSFWSLIAFLFGTESPVPYRIFNYFLFASSAYLLFSILQKYSKDNFTQRWILPFTSTLFYVIHPTQIESVIWISSARTLLATTFALLSLYFYIYPENTDSSKKQSYTFLAYIFFVAGIFSKPSVIFLPISFIIFDLVLNKKTIKEAFKKISPMLPFIIIFGVLHLQNIKNPELFQSDISSRIIIFLDSVIHYARLLLTTQNLTFNYGRTIQVILESFQSDKVSFYLLSVGIIAFITLGSSIRKTRDFFLMLICFYLLLFPTMGFFQFDFQNVSTIANRYMNLALVPISILLFLLQKKLTIKGLQKPTYGIMTFIIIFFCYRSINFGHDWRTAEKLLLKNKETYYIKLALAQNYQNEGNFLKAEKFLKEAWSMEPTAYEAPLKLIKISRIVGDKEKTLHLLDKFESFNIPIPANHLHELAQLYLSVQDYKKAIHYLQLSIRNNNEDRYSITLIPEIRRRIEEQRKKFYINTAKDLVKRNDNTLAQEILKRIENQTIDTLDEVPRRHQKIQLRYHEK